MQTGSDRQAPRAGVEGPAQAPPTALLGCGAWGRNWARVLRAEGALAGVADPTGAGRDEARRMAPEVPVFSSLDALLRDPGIRAVVVATPAETHFELARRVLESGRDVLVEKPLTTDVGGAAELVRCASERGRVLMVGHLLEYHPAVQAIHALVARGELGKLFYLISNRLNLGRIRREENALWSFAPHDLAVILRLMGTGRAQPTQVSATGGCYIQPNVADATVTQLLFDDGARAQVFVSWLHPFKEQRLVAIGSERMASWDDVAKRVVLYERKVAWERGQPVPTRGEGVEVPIADEEPLAVECRHFLDCVVHRRRPLTDGESGLRVLEILDAAQRSMVMNGVPVPIASVDERPSRRPSRAPSAPGWLQAL